MIWQFWIENIWIRIIFNILQFSINYNTNRFNLTLSFSFCFGFDFTLNMAWSVRRCRSVKTSRGFFGDDRCSATTGISSFRLHPLNGISALFIYVWQRKINILQNIIWARIYSKFIKMSIKTINFLFVFTYCPVVEFELLRVDGNEREKTKNNNDKAVNIRDQIV